MTDHDRDEWRSAVRSMTELERVQACGHYYQRAVCVHCGHVGADWSDA